MTLELAEEGEQRALHALVHDRRGLQPHALGQQTFVREERAGHVLEDLDLIRGDLSDGDGLVAICIEIDKFCIKLMNFH